MSNTNNEVSNKEAFLAIWRIILIIFGMSILITLGSRVIGKIDTYNDNSKNTVIEIVKENPYIQKNQ